MMLTAIMIAQVGYLMMFFMWRASGRRFWPFP